MSETKYIQPSPSTTLTTETSLSLLYRVLRTVIRPFRPRLVKPGKALPAGSPRLTSHPQTKNKCRIVEHQHESTGLWLYDVIPNSRTTSHSPYGGENKHRILYFAGGGFQSPPSNEHWAFVSMLASAPELASIFDFTIVSYPLAPNSPACDSLPVLRTFLRSVCDDAVRNGGKVSLMGDSAGGNIALSLGLWWVDEISQQKTSIIEHTNGGSTIGTSKVGEDDETTINTDGLGENLTLMDPRLLKENSSNSVLSNILVISPAADLRNTNPDIKKVDLQDPLLSMSLIEQTAKAWTQANPSKSMNSNPSSRSDPYISPVCVSRDTLAHLKQQATKIHGIIGTHDVLAPDAELFRRQCVDSEIDGDWLVWQGQMHCFVLAGVYGMKEGKQGIQWVIEALSKNS